MYKAVIFDAGGVLIRTEDPRGRYKWEDKLGLKRGELDAIVFDSETAKQATLGAVPESQIWDDILQKFDLTREELSELKIDFWSGDHLDMELAEFIRSLRPLYKTAILSNAWTGARVAMFEKFQLVNAIDVLIISAEENLMKPDGKIFYLAARRLGVLPEESIFVDDIPHNVTGAEACGMAGIVYKNTQQVIADIKHLLSA